eukprot:1145936-Pelagomonas_calceolata.AAC.1
MLTHPHQTAHPGSRQCPACVNCVCAHSSSSCSCGFRLGQQQGCGGPACHRGAAKGDEGVAHVVPPFGGPEGRKHQQNKMR